MISRHLTSGLRCTLAVVIRIAIVTTACGPLVGQETELPPRTSAAGQELRERFGYLPSASHLLFSLDGKLLAAASGRQAVVWDAAKGKELLTFDRHQEEILSIQFLADGKRLLTTARLADRTVPIPGLRVRARVPPEGELKIWDATSGEVTLKLLGERDSIGCIALSPDGTRLASVGAMWDTATGRQLATWKEPASLVSGMTFSPDGKWLASFGRARSNKPKPERIVERGVVVLRDGATGEQKTVWQDFGAVMQARFSPDGNQLATASSSYQGEPGGLKVWDVSSRREAFSLPSPGQQFEFSPDGKSLLTFYTHGGDFRLWDSATGQEVFSLFMEGHRGLHVLFSPDSKRLMTLSHDSEGKRRQLHLRDAPTGVELFKLAGFAGKVTSFAFSPNSRQLAVSTSGGLVEPRPAGRPKKSVGGGFFSPSHDADEQPGEVKVWDVASGAEVLAWKTMGGEVHRLAFSPDGKQLARADHYGVTVRSLAAGDEQRTLRGHTRDVLSVAFSPDGKQVASGSADGTIKLWDAALGEEQRTLQHVHFVASVAYRPDGKRLASASWDETLKIWDPATGKEIHSWKAHEGENARVESVAWSPDGGRLFSAGSRGAFDGEAKIWDASSGKLLVKLVDSRQGSIARAAFKPDGKRLATFDIGNQLIDWNAADGQAVGQLRKRVTPTLSAAPAFSTDGTRLASAGTGGEINLFDAESGESLLDWRDERKVATRCLEFSFDGKRLASGDVAGGITIWDATEGKKVQTLRGHFSAIYGLAFSPDGKRLVSASADNTVKLWDVSSGDPTSLK